MKILLVEDEERNIVSAKMQLKGHELVIVRSYIEIMDLDRSIWESIDFVLTDMNVRMGSKDKINSFHYEVYDRYDSDTLLPCGLLIAMHAIDARIPCVMVTDANGHEDALGMMIEARVHAHKHSHRSRITLFHAITRPSWVSAGLGNGKDWMAAINNSVCAKAFTALSKSPDQKKNK